MTLRRPAAHLRRAPSRRRSGDESSWESLYSEGEFLPCVSRPPRAPRPQSAIEGGHLDSWLEHLQRMQNDLLTAPVHERVPAFNDRTTSMPALHKEQTGQTWRHQGIPSFSRGSPSCGSPSLCESSLGSQESLHTGFYPPSENRGSWERVHIMQAPRTEKAQLSYLSPVKIGWLPIQRRVMMVADTCDKPNRLLDHSVGQVKLKQPITPTFHKNQPTPKAQDGEVERSHTTSTAFGLKTRHNADQGCHIIKQVPEKQSFSANNGDRPVGWHALRRGWNTVRVSAFPGFSQSTEISAGTGSDPNRKSPLIKTTSIDSLKHTPPQQTSSEPYRPHAPLQRTNNTEIYKTPLQRTSSVQPIRATAPLLRTNSVSEASHIQTSSVATTLIPQSKAGFSSITISSRKVSRSASLPCSDTYSHSSRSSESPSPPLTQQPMDPNSTRVTLQRKATIVKVTEQRVTSSLAPAIKREVTPPASNGLDTVVHRRKATIIKVTEHRESYSPANVRSGRRLAEHRHSYTDGLYKSQHIEVPSYDHLDYTKTPNQTTSEPEKNGGNLHRSTLNLLVINPAATAAPAPAEVSLKAAGHRSAGPRRPQSCYGKVSGHTEPREEDVTRPPARRGSFETLQQDTGINLVNSDSSFISPGTAVKEAGQLVANNPKLNRGERGRVLPLEDAARRASPCLTLIKAPYPHSNQTAEEVLALNAAAIIANIKLQRQLSKKKTPNGNSERDAAASLLGNTDTRMKPHPDQSHKSPHAGFVSLSPEPERSPETVSLQDALQRSRPDFISRSQGRVKELERRAKERRELADPQSSASLRQKETHSTRFTSLNDNLSKPRDRVITVKETPIRSKRATVEVKRKKTEERSSEECVSNRQRVELFSKKLLDQILQRSNN